MGSFLDKLRTTITETQARQITNLLVKKKESGEITNLEEFRSRLSELTAKLLADHITPSLQLFLGELNQVIDSETFNFMLDRIRDDLETSFIESNSLSDILDAHKTIINNVLIKSIKLGIAELEAKVSTYEFLARNTSGFDNAQFNTFKGAQNLRTSRTDLNFNVLFRDPRTNGLLENDVTLDLIGESILLAGNVSLSVIPKSIRQIFDSTSTQSVSQVAFESSNINNVIDGSDGTFWVYSILQQNAQPKITVKLELDLGNYFDINFVNIQAATIFPMILEELQYIDTNGLVQTLQFTDDITNTPTSVYFNRITTNKLFLIFSQKNALELQYTNKTIADNYDKAVLGQSSNIDIDSIALQVKELITSSRIIQDVLLLPANVDNATQQRVFDYSIGFDNISVGYSTFKQSSVFVSSPVTINSLAQLAIKSKETRPMQLADIISMSSDTYPTEDVGQYFHGSIEYWGILFNYESNAQLIDIDIIPLLPVGVERIYHESLVLGTAITSNINNTGTLMFYTKHFNQNDIDNIKLYRNGTLLTYMIDWVIDDSITNDIVAPSGNPNLVGIRIVNPSLTDFYTVSYTPLISNSRAHPIDVADMSLESSSSFIKIVDLVGDGSVRIGLDNISYVSSKKNDGKVTSYSKIYLAIILRRSSPNENLSPAVQEYLLLTSSTSNGQ